MSAGDIAGLVVACAAAVLLLSMIYPVLKLARILTAVENDVVRGKIVDILGEAQTSVGHVNANLENVESVSANARDISTNARALTAAFSATLGSPLVKVAAFSYGVRRAASKDAKAKAKRERRTSRRGAGRTGGADVAAEPKATTKAATKTPGTAKKTPTKRSPRKAAP